jgi:hypothetical protein
MKGVSTVYISTLATAVASSIQHITVCCSHSSKENDRSWNLHLDKAEVLE